VASVGIPPFAAGFYLSGGGFMPPRTLLEISDRVEQLLAKTGARDRAAIEKRLALLDADPDEARATLWRRLLVKLSDLVTLPAHPVSPHAMQFFIADGKYRMQVFAMEDAGDGFLILYLPDLLVRAVNDRLLVKNGCGYSPAEAPDQILAIQQMDVSTINPPDFMKHMTGWNRKAVKLTLDVSPGDSAQVAVAEQLCELAAAEWGVRGVPA
jgi:hypothetical protein